MKASVKPLAKKHQLRLISEEIAALSDSKQPLSGLIQNHGLHPNQWLSIIRRFKRFVLTQKGCSAGHRIIAILFMMISVGCDGTSNPTNPEEIDPSPGSSEVARLPEASSSESPAAPDDTIGANSVSQSTAAVQSSNESMTRRQNRLRQAEKLEVEKRFVEASQILRQELLANPNDTEVLFRIANLTASSGDLDSAVSFLDSISPDDLEAGLPALGQAADWCMELKRYRDAEDRYRKILEIAPEATIAHRRLGLLLNRQGRRHEAAKHLQELCKLGDVRQDELHALIVLSDAMGMAETDPSDSDLGRKNPEEKEGIQSSSTNDRQAPLPASADNPKETDYSPLNDWGLARILFTQRKYAEAAELLGRSCDPVKASSQQGTSEKTSKIKFPPPPASIIALYGRAIAESQQDDEFARWLQLTQKHPNIEEYSEYWSAIGTFLASQQKTEPACRALLEGLARDPTDFRSMNRLHQMLELTGNVEQAKKWEARWKANREVLLANNAISSSETPNVTAMDEVASQLAGLGRNVEAVLWKMLESFHRGQDKNVIDGWNQQRQQLVLDNQCFPSLEIKICGMKPQQFPLPKLEELRKGLSKDSTSINLAGTVSDSLPLFKNVAKQMNIGHQYQLASTPLDSGFAMYHQAGGGVAIIDYDLDGKQDFYFAQGAADAPTFQSQVPNSLFRNNGSSFTSVANLSATDDLTYTIGCTSGDWNQDGFPDLITTNLGINHLFLNNGDGTFTRQSIAGTENLNNMSASVAIADLDGDSLPDLFEVNYIMDAQIDMRPERDNNGQVIEAVGPADFQPAEDRIGINDGQGGLRFLATQVTPETTYRGLGLVVTDFDGDGINEIFIGNDKSPNQLWKLSETGENQVDQRQPTWMDIAMPLGVAFSFDGGGTASMGIASGDFDQSGTLDLHVANFQNENACLYLAQNKNFQDRAAQFRLGVPSYEVLGFGCQAIDFNLDGYLDLAVTNGHIDLYQKMSGDFLQRFQLFKNLGKRFIEVDWSKKSAYTSTPHLGRSMAKCDFDNDGKEDLVITHLNEPSAILRNETITNNRWLQLQLAGTRSERDAVGAKVTVKYGDQKLTQWVTSGDGYLCRNHNLLCFGLGETQQIDSIEVTWPSGITEQFKGSDSNQRLLIIENNQELFPLIQ